MDGNITLRLKTIFSKPRAVIIAAAIIFLPLLFIGTHSSHDWGDDFAQYIHQAGNIVHGIPQSETGFVYSQQNFIGPQTYPVGFPLLLSPVYALAGNNIGAFITLISLLYILLGLLMIVFFRQYFSLITAFVLALIFVYNPSMVLFKREVMSDIPFTALLVLNFILYQKAKSGNLKHIIVLVLTTGFMITIRPTGVIFIAAAMMSQICLFIKKHTKLSDFAIRGVIIILLPLTVYYVINIIIFKIPSGGSIRDYLLFYNSGKLTDIIPENLSHHFEAFRFLYVPQSGVLMGLSIILGSMMLAMTLIGFLKRLLPGPEFIEWFFIFYVIMLLLFPNNNSALRLMVPLGFITLFYAATGLKTIQLLPQVPGWKKAVAIGALIMILYMPGLIGIIRSGDNTIEGPQQASAVETFKYMNKNVPADAVVVFAKPRALALYAGCCSMTDPRAKDPTLFHIQVMDGKATYLLLCNQLTDELMYRYSRVMQKRITKQFENKNFVLYKINPIVH